jgi:hypothetical protein
MKLFSRARALRPLLSNNFPGKDRDRDLTLLGRLANLPSLFGRFAGLDQQANLRR